MKVLFLDVDGVHTATAIANMRKRRQEAKHGN